VTEKRDLVATFDGFRQWLGPGEPLRTERREKLGDDAGKWKRSAVFHAITHNIGFCETSLSGKNQTVPIDKHISRQKQRVDTKKRPRPRNRNLNNKNQTEGQKVTTKPEYPKLCSSGI
jgi:butyrate kinase